MTYPIWGLFTGLLSSVFFASNRIVARRGLAYAETYAGVLLSQLMAVPFFGLLVVLFGETEELLHLNTIALLSLAVAGAVHYTLGRTFSYTSFKLVGANVSSPVISIQTLVSVLLGIILLGESFSWSLLLGSGLVVTGVITLSRSSSKGVSEFESKPKEFRRGMAAALCAGLIFGMTPLLVRVGLQESQSVFAGLLVSYLAALVLYMPLLAVKSYRDSVGEMKKGILVFFIASGFLTNISQLLKYAALSIAPVSIVAPALGVSPIFVLALSSVFARKLEFLNLPVALGTLQVVAGVIIASASQAIL